MFSYKVSAEIPNNNEHAVGSEVDRFVSLLRMCFLFILIFNLGAVSRMEIRKRNIKSIKTMLSRLQTKHKWFQEWNWPLEKLDYRVIPNI